MNIPFVTGDKDLDAEVIAYTKAAGFENLKGHKSVGGLRASIYNAMPKDGVHRAGRLPEEVRSGTQII